MHWKLGVKNVISIARTMIHVEHSSAQFHPMSLKNLNFPDVEERLSDGGLSQNSLLWVSQILETEKTGRTYNYLKTIRKSGPHF